MTTIGPNLFARNPDGRYTSAIATYFPRHKVLVTSAPLHALQREVFKDSLVKEAAEGRREPLSDQTLAWEMDESVDLIIAQGDVVQIRPELERLDLALKADEDLKTLWNVPIHRIRFLSVRDPRVRQALREQGALWRISSQPHGRAEIDFAIAESRVGIGGRAIYYYNPHTGTRWVTFDEFAHLGGLSDADLAGHLDEIAEHCLKRNRFGNPEVAFFGVDSLKFGGPSFAGARFEGLPSETLRRRHLELAGRFREATEPDLLVDRVESAVWRARMFASIASEKREEATSELLHGLNPEFFLRIRWLPGGHFDEGEFVFAPVFPDGNRPPADPDLLPLWDSLARGFIANLIREYGNIEYLNLGRIEANPATAAPGVGRRGVYLAEIKARGEAAPQVLFLRVLRWGIRERLDRPSPAGGRPDLMQAVFETEEYVDYTLDRRLGCMQFGMHLPSRVNMRRVTELYQGRHAEFRGRRFPVIYFERDYLPGIATDKLPVRKLADSRYALALARLMGKAAAPNLVVGRTRPPEGPGAVGEPLFDDGDEIVVEGSNGLPVKVVLVDHGGAFADWRTPSLLPFARAYAAPVNRRADQVPDPRAFAEEYLAGFHEELRRIHSDYFRRQQAFDGLFKHLEYDPAGNFACRWEHVLERLGIADVERLIREIRSHITVLSAAEV
ncbi:MAG: hypothetical protein AB7O66_04430 [Limisphaerales bacterium]